MADVKGIMMGGAGHDAAVIVAAQVGAAIAKGVEMQPQAIIENYEFYRDALLRSNEKAQNEQREADLPSDPGAVVVHLKAAEGKTIRELFETDEKVGIGTGAEYLTWIVGGPVGERNPALAATIRKFLEGQR